MSVLSVEIRRSPMRWVAPLLLLTQVTMMFTRTTEWIGQWPQTSAVAQVGTFLSGAVAAAASAWSAGRWARVDGDLILPGGQLRALCASGYPLLAGTTWAILAYLVGAFIAAATTWWSAVAPDGFLWPNYLLLGAAVLVIGCALGHILGLFVPGPAAPPIAAVLMILLSYTWTTYSESRGTASVLIVVSGPAAVTLSLEALGVRALVALLLVAAAITWTPTALIRRGGRLSTAAVAVPMALAAVAVASQVGRVGPLVVPRSPPPEPACAGADIVVCVWPEDIKYLNPAVDMAQRIHDASPEYGFRLPGTVYERGVGPRPDEGFMVNAGRWMIADWLGAKAVVDTVPLCGSDDETAQRDYYTALENLVAFATAVAFGGGQPADIHSTSAIPVLPGAGEARDWVWQQREAASRACE